MLQLYHPHIWQWLFKYLKTPALLVFIITNRTTSHFFRCSRHTTHPNWITQQTTIRSFVNCHRHVKQTEIITNLLTGRRHAWSALLRMPSRCGQWYLLNDCQNQIKLIFLHQVDFIDLVDFANNQVDILASGRLFWPGWFCRWTWHKSSRLLLQWSQFWAESSRFFLTESNLRTVESNVAQIESILITIGSILSRIESILETHTTHFWNRQFWNKRLAIMY